MTLWRAVTAPGAGAAPTECVTPTAAPASSTGHLVRSPSTAVPTPFYPPLLTTPTAADSSAPAAAKEDRVKKHLHPKPAIAHAQNISSAPRVGSPPVFPSLLSLVSVPLDNDDRPSCCRRPRTVMAARPSWTRASALLALAPYAARAAAYSFNFKTTPRQCQTLEIDVVGTGSPPYSALIIPFGPTPLPNSVEARRITSVAFNTTTSASFQLKFPENSQFVAVVSDSTGFGSGGTSAAVTVLSGDDGCFDTTTSVSPAFFIHIEPTGVLYACDATRIWWDPSTVEGDTTFQGVIPGGQSFQIPQGPLSNVTGQGTGFSWTPSVQVGTTVLLVGGDGRGIGSAGSNSYTIQESSVGLSCLNSTSPSSTPGSPAGGSYPTSTDGSGTNSGTSGGSHTNVGAIVGGVIGGVVGAIAIALVLLFAVRRQRFHKGTKERPVDLLQDQDGEGGASDGRPPEYYRPEPFLLPDPTVASTVDGSVAGGAAGARPSADHRRSHLSQSSTESGTAAGASGYLRAPASSAPSSSTRKSAAPPSFRPVNIIQHDDAGPSDPPPPPPEEPETIELPPAYTNIRRNDIAPPKDEEEEEAAAGGAGATGATTQVPQAAQA